MSFNYDLSPQNLLDELHAVNIPALFTPQMGKRQRLEAIALALAELKDTEDKLQKNIARTEKRHKKNFEEAKRASGAYQKVLELTHELQESVKDLENRVKNDKVIPPAFAFGSRLFGSEEMDEWHLGDDDTAHNWDQLMRLRLRLNTIEQERKPLEAELKKIQTALNAEKSTHDKLHKAYQRRSKRRYMLSRLGFLFILGASIFAAGAYFYTEMVSPVAEIPFDVLSIGLMGIGGIILLVIPLAIVRRYRWLARTRDEMKQSRIRIKELQEQGKKIHQRYRPVQHSYRDVAHQYQQLRTMF